MPTSKPIRPVDIEQPFPGLRPFDLNDAFLFFGRDTHTQDLLDRLARNRFLAVVGTSGSGKSSLVRAGLMPALLRGYLVGATSHWRIAVMRPGSGPISQLAETLSAKDVLDTDCDHLRATLGGSSYGLVSAVKAAGLGPGESLLVFVDQFEELFRFAAERRISESSDGLLFVASLLEAVDSLDTPVYVVLTMRTDFLGDCTAFAGLPEALNRSQYLIPRLSREQRREAIERPIEIANAEIAPRLVRQILNDMGDDPDQLPVMQHALARMYRLWKSSGGHTPIDLEDYEKSGAVASALNEHAQSIYDGFAPADREWTRKLFRCLTTMERGREVRRPSGLDRIFRVTGADQPADREAVLNIIELFARKENSLLLVTRDDRLEDRIVDISHESLIRKWRQLGNWVKEEAESAEWFYDLLRDTARQAKGEADYWVNPELSRVLDRRKRDGWTAAWAEQYASKGSFTTVENFLERSQTRERNRRRNRYLVSAIIVMLVVTALTAVNQFHHASMAGAELLRLSAERQLDKAKLADLERQRESAHTEADKLRLDAAINAVKNRLITDLQQENRDLKAQLAASAKQNNPLLEDRILPAQVEALNRQVSDLSAKARQAETLRKKNEDLIQELSQLPPLRQERDQLRREREALTQQLTEARTTLASQPKPPDGPSGSQTPGSGPSEGLGPSGPRREVIKGPVDVVPLTNDTAVSVSDAGIILLLKHMGSVPFSADLYVLSGKPEHPSDAVEPYSGNKQTGDRYVTRIKTVLHGCNGKSADMGGYTVWCYHVDGQKVSAITGAQQHLGAVTGNGSYDLFAVAFDFGGPAISVAVRPKK
jgi:hypothetical protein